MSDRPTILHITRLGSTFRFQITKPDQILSPIMKIWDVDVRAEFVSRLCEELSKIIQQHSSQPIPIQAQERIEHLGKALYHQLILPGLGGDHLQSVLGGDSLPLLISTNVPEIPWELLHDGQNFLGLKYAIGRQLLKSTAVPITTPWQSDRMRCLLIADPCDDLPEARKEAETLKQWLAQQGIECDLLLGNKANVTEIIIQLSSGSYNFIHYSGHADADPATKIPRLVLNDQPLSSTEIERAVSNNGPVVILNGCDTASVEGLADAFIKSGAQLVVGTLFDVPDAGARRWAEVFYKGLISKQQAGEALRLARQATLKDPACSTAWMAFVMYGNPCLQLIWGKKEPETLLDRALQTIELGRKVFDNACLNVLESSLKNAGRTGHVGSAHLFTAMLEGPDSQLRDYLQEHGVDPTEMRRQFETSNRFGDLLFQMIQVDAETGISLSDSVSHILRAAHEHAQQFKHSQATFDDLLAAFSQQDSGMSTLLRAMGVDLKEMVRNLGIEPSPGKVAKPLKTQDEEPRGATDVTIAHVAQKTGQIFRTRGARVADDQEARPEISQRFADVSFPASITRSRWHVLRVQILATRRNERNLELDVETSEQTSVEVCVQAPGFEAMETLQRAIAIPRAGDSKTIEFRLRASKPGAYQIRVDFLQNQRYIGTTRLYVDVIEESVKTQPVTHEHKAKTSGQPAIGQTGDVPDLTILITQQRLEAGKHSLKFLLRSPSADLGLYYRDVGESVLSKSPEEWVENVLKQVQEMAETDDVEVERRLRNIGQTLWAELIPKEFKDIYWRIRDKIRTVQIVTDEPWIPWEMVFPYRNTQQGVIEEDDFLCQKFSLARWLRGAPPLPRIPLDESRIMGVGADSSRHFALLPGVDDEISVVKSILEGIGARAISLDPSRADLFRNLEQGGFHHLHIACHGSASPKGGDLAVIMLKDGKLAPLDIRGVAENFGHDHPFVFLNACETGRLGASLTQLGGWAERFLAVGCSAFIGTLWKVSDDSAQKFARIFYDAICQGVTLGEACQRARSGVRAGGDPTWLAYCLYADPQATVVLPGEPSLGETVVKAPVTASPEDIGQESPTERINILEEAERIARARWPEGDESPQLGFSAERYTQVVLDALKQSTTRAIRVQVAFIDSLLFFEALLEIEEGAAAQAFERLGVSVQELIRGFRKINNDKTPSPKSSTEEIGISKSVVEILKIAQHLADQSKRDQAHDQDVLEAFVLHGKNGVARLLIDLGLEPELLLNGAFQEDGALNDERFSKAAKSVLDGALHYAQRARLVGSPHLLAALVVDKGGLARKAFKVKGGSIDSYVKQLLDEVTIYQDRPEPDCVSLDTCSTRARRILNLAELLARVDATVVEDAHLLKAYLHCTQPSK
jgi:CHAT domain-containing protein